MSGDRVCATSLSFYNNLAVSRVTVAFLDGIGEWCLSEAEHLLCVYAVEFIASRKSFQLICRERWLAAEYCVQP